MPIASAWQVACAVPGMNSRGSTLIEVLVAMLVLTSGVLAMAQLFLVAAATNVSARHTTVVATLAAQKMEQLLSADVSERPETIDHVDGSGRLVGSDDVPPPDAVYTRRWTIEPLTEDSLVIRVRVGRTDRSGTLRRMSGETQVSTIRTRRRP
jgi:type II secretory pathway pseudopilin PulG